MNNFTLTSTLTSKILDRRTECWFKPLDPNHSLLGFGYLSKLETQGEKFIPSVLILPRAALGTTEFLVSSSYNYHKKSLLGSPL